MIKEQALDDYERGTLLGHGGQASVHKYTYPPTNEIFAVKILRLTCERPGDRQLRKKDREWILREVVVTSMSNHVRLLRAREIHQYPSGFALVMPYYELGHLCSVKANSRFDFVQKKEATRQILDGLRELHRLDRIHRDIKPDNILVQSLQPLNLVIGDFGQVSLASPMTKVGSTVYCAPEIYHYRPMGRQHTNAVDIYSVGMLILWFLGRGVVGAEIEREEIWNQEQYDRFVGSKIAAAIRNHPEGEEHLALVMAQTMAQWDPERRPSAEECLHLPWLRPVEDAPVEDASVEDAPVEDAPVEDAPVEDAPVEDAPVEDAPVEDAPERMATPRATGLPRRSSRIRARAERFNPMGIPNGRFETRRSAISQSATEMLTNSDKSLTPMDIDSPR